MSQATPNSRTAQLALRVERTFSAGELKAGLKLLAEYKRMKGVALPPYRAGLEAALKRGDRAAAESVLALAAGAGMAAGRLAYLQGTLALATGDSALALNELRRAFLLEPTDIDIQRGLASLLGTQGDYRACIELYQRVVVHPEVQSRDFSNLARALASVGEFSAAERAIERALGLDAKSLHAYTVLAWSRQQAGDLDAAEAALAEARRLAPRDVTTLGLSASVAHNAKRLSDALQWHRAALQLDPQRPQLWNGLAGTWVELDQVEEARVAYRKAASLGGSSVDRLQAALLVPAIPQSEAEIASVRAGFIPALEQAAAEGVRIEEPLAEVQIMPFYLAYHGLSNRELHTALAQYYRQFCPRLAMRAAHCERYRGPAGRIRVGVISAHFFDHSIGRTTRGFVERLDRARFTVVVIFIGEPTRDALSEHFAQSADEYLVLTQAVLGDAQQRLAALKLDVLFYQDIGMEPVSYFLAHARLAPVQCYSFGHPDTTGLPDMDWFVSSDLFEPEGAEAHYSERLHCLPNVGTLAWYHRPAVAMPIPRAALGIAADAHFYFCAQTLFKLHPSFDRLLQGILEQDPKAVIGLVHSSRPMFAERLRQRLNANLGALATRVQVLPRVSTSEFHGLLAAADVLLDTTHFNGMNTSLEGFAQGKPVVTLPMALQRGRHTAGMYRRMGLAEAIAQDADDYVRRAVAWGSDAEAREHFAARLRVQSEHLFHDDAVIRGFEAFFEMAVAAASSAA